MTYSTLAAIVKYPYASSLARKKAKFGFFESEKETYRRIATELGIPGRESNRVFTLTPATRSSTLSRRPTTSAMK